MIGWPLLIALIFAVFGQTVRFGYSGWDDDIHIHDNPYLNPATRESLARFWREPYQKLYIPLTYTAWSGVAAAVQAAHPESPDPSDHPAPFHAANVLLHALNAVLVLLLLRSLLPREAGSLSSRESLDKLAPFLGSLLFAWHPVQVEPVAWATGLKDLLCGTFSLGALLAYVAHARGGGGTLLAAAGACLTLALLAKPGAAAVPFMALILDAGVLRRPLKDAARASGPGLLLAAAWLALTKRLQPDAGLGYVPPLWARPFVALDALAFYARKLVAPLALCPEYGRTPQAVLASSSVWAAWLVPAGLAWAARGRPAAAASLALLAAGVLPVLGLVPFQHQRYSTVADRYLYLSMLGPALGLAGLVRARGRAAAWAGAALLAALGVRSAFQARHWRGAESLFEETLRVNPRSAVAHNNLGHVLQTSGRTREAVEHYEAALRLDPSHGIAHNNLGNIELLAGRPQAAVPHYERALGSPSTADRVDANNNLGLAAARLGRPEEAERRYREALRLDPDYEKAHNNWGLLLGAQGRTPEAMEAFRRALALKPDYADARRNLSALLNDLGFDAARRGRREEAVAALEEALRVRPDNLQAAANLGDLHLRAGDADAAIRVWEAALRVLPLSPELHHNLAVACLRKSDRAGARRHAEEALRLSPGFPPSASLLKNL